MKIAAIICEYNPFHNGHSYQMEKIREKYPDAVIISLMSGDFVQRGNFAVLPKYERAKAAVLCGADIVLSLPFPYCASSAEFFATGAVEILSSLNCVDVLCFGTEAENAEALLKIAKRISTSEYRNALEKSLAEAKNSPTSHIKVKALVYEELYGEPFPSHSNDILALEYICAYLKKKKMPEFLSLKRKDGFSATRAREKYKSDMGEFERLVPKNAYEVYSAYKPVSEDSISSYISGLLRTAVPAEMEEYSELSGGLAYRICKKAQDCYGFDELCLACATKKYTDAKIRRAILSYILKIKPQIQKATPCYTMLLAMKKEYGGLLKHISKNSDIKIITKAAHYKKMSQDIISAFEKELYAEKIYRLCLEASGISAKNMLKSPFIL